AAANLLQQRRLSAVRLVELVLEPFGVVARTAPGPHDPRDALADAHVHQRTGRVTRVVDETEAGKGRATPSRKEALAARKKQMKTPLTRKEQAKRERAARESMRTR